MITELTRAAEGTGHGGGVDRVPAQSRVGASPGNDTGRRRLVADEVGQSVDYTGKR